VSYAKLTRRARGYGADSGDADACDSAGGVWDDVNQVCIATDDSPQMTDVSEAACAASGGVVSNGICVPESSEHPTVTLPPVTVSPPSTSTTSPSQGAASSKASLASLLGSPWVIGGAVLAGVLVLAASTSKKKPATPNRRSRGR